MSRDESPVVRSAESDDGYTFMHRAFLQAFMTRNVMTADEINPVLASVMTAHEPERPWSAGDITQPHLTSLLQQINAKIEPYNFEIRSTRDQRTKETLYALVNTTSDSLTQLATKFSAGEIAYIRRVLDHMFETNNTRIREVMAIKHTEASQLARLSRRNRQSQANGDATQAGEATQAADPGISIPEADDVLATLVNDGFFQQSRAGYYSLAPRALMELRAYLKETYNEAPEEADEGEEPVVRIRDCEGCREIVTFGVRCNNRDCGVRWHDACASSYYRGRSRENRACPKCQTVCSGDVYVGERADRVARHSGMGRARNEEEED